ncbi:MAG: hypothetical protein KC996_03125 [Phycisphaerales bacterium]|nr:hypothetical protein [Phycisphaerales bacterium]
MPNTASSGLTRSGITLLLALCGLASSAHAQWSDDSTMHVTVADGAGEQVQPKVAAAPDGGSYVSWYSSQTGYDVRLQRLDASGNEMWAHNGILIADRGFSSTQDYDLAVDTSGHAVLAFRDDRFGGTKITVQRVAPDGSTPWGANGVQFGNGTDFVASPDIAITSEGGSVVAWGNDAETRLAGLGADGSVQWNSTIAHPTGGTALVASMHGADNGSVIISWVQYVSFLGAKHLYAQKIDNAGAEAWASRVAVYDGGSLQFGNFPEFIGDGFGGALFSWYDTANGLNVYAQRLASDGTEMYPHNGASVSTNPRERVAPTIAFYPETGLTGVAWVELDNNQGSSGIYAQMLDASGNRMLGDSGVVVSPIDSNESGTPNAHMLQGNLAVMWIENNGVFGQDRVLARGIDAIGGDAFSTVEIASDLAYRARLTSSLNYDRDNVIAAWQIGDFGVADIETHNLNPDGTIGAAADCPADFTGDGSLDIFDVFAFLDAFNSMDPSADFTGDGSFDIFDVFAFLDAFNAGCP